MIVVDTNLLAHLFIPGEHNDTAEGILHRDSHWIAPILWRSEFRNVLVKHMRAKNFPLTLATSIMHKAEKFLEGREYKVASDNVLELASKSGCSAYDCEFVVLAEGHKTFFVTSDVPVIKAFPRTAIFRDEFLKLKLN